MILNGTHHSTKNIHNDSFVYIRYLIIIQQPEKAHQATTTLNLEHIRRRRDE